jgi:hypothetical protein
MKLDWVIYVPAADAWQVLKNPTTNDQAKESKMGIALWIVGAIALMAAGAGVTFALASLIPQDVLQQAQANGRFAGLSADSHDEISGRPVRAAVSKLAHLRRQVG